MGARTLTTLADFAMLGLAIYSLVVTIMPMEPDENTPLLQRVGYGETGVGAFSAFSAIISAAHSFFFLRRARAAEYRARVAAEARLIEHEAEHEARIAEHEAREEILGLLVDGKYPTVLERITDPDGNVELYKTSLSSVLLTRAGGNIQTCKGYADALENSARIAGEDILYALRDIFDIGGGYHYIHLYLDIWRVHLNEAAPDVRAQQEAAIRTYAEEHPDDSTEVLQMLEHFTDEAAVNLDEGLVI